MKTILFLSLFSLFSINAELPIWPATPNHPSSQNYQYSVFKEIYNVEGREVVVYGPVPIKKSSFKSIPVLVYGHAQAIGLSAYEKTFIHLARKGIGVIFPQYDSGLFDRDELRMGRDYSNLVVNALQRFPHFDSNQVVFSGHSKGASIALIAAALPRSLVKPKSVLLFSPASFNEVLLSNMNPNIRLSAIWGQGDKVVSKELVEEIVDKSPTTFKQFIEVGSYPSFNSGHFYPLHKRVLFGGFNGVHAFHFFGVWPWIFGAVKKEGSDYLYGERADDMGVSTHTHLIKRYGTL